MNTIRIPEILLPEDVYDMTAWAVNACDQYTSDLEYWREVEKITRGKVSSYNLIYPEIYLGDRTQERIDKINRTMREYLENGVFKSVSGGFVLVERATQSGVRCGIVLAVDLEDYSFERGAKCAVRSTEATILERIPPRVKIRENAEIELPHVMLLYEDENDTVLKSVKRGKVLYDFGLMQGGGKVKGTFIENATEITEKFYALAEKNDGFLFAVGDGNHSLATAKTCWDKIKIGLSETQRQNHPARYALCEVVNIYDKSLNFEPIHRLVKTDDTQGFLKGLKTSGGKIAYTVTGGKKEQIKFCDDIPAGIRELDGYISDFIKAHGGEVDYIHGESEISVLTGRGGVGVLLPPIKKSDFFSLIVKGGNLPRKTFSMGEGNEKRYYIEAKKIK